MLIIKTKTGTYITHAAISIAEFLLSLNLDLEDLQDLAIEKKCSNVF